MKKLQLWKSALVGGAIVAASAAQTAMAAIPIDTTDLIGDISSLRTPMIAVGLSVIGIVVVARGMKLFQRAV